MNKKTFMVAISISALLICSSGFSTAKAYIKTPSGIYLTYGQYITFPDNKETYASRFLDLNVSFHPDGMFLGGDEYSMTYSVDGERNQTFPLMVYYLGFMRQSETYIYGSINLPELSEGSHNVTVYVKYESTIFTGYDSQTVNFSILDMNTPASTPAVSASFEGPLGNFNIVSPSNITYNTNMLSLNVTGKVIVGSNVRLIINYSLDGKELVQLPLQTNPAHPEDPFIGVINTIVLLPELSNGSHNITVFGDLEANGPHLAQATVFFTINKQSLETSIPSASPANSPTPYTSNTSSPPSTTQKPTLEPTQTSSPTLEPISSLKSLPIITGILIVIIVAVTGVLVYFKKHKRS
jgi:hypothetical protein